MLGKQEPIQFGFDNPPLQGPPTRAGQLLTQIAKLVDLEPVRVMVAPYFADRGRPSIDPVMMVKMMLLAYLFGINSDRQLVDECADRLSFRRFLGLGLNDPVPAHSSFTHWRQRLGADFFRSLLHQIVMQCVAQGMELSQARTVDTTGVKAQADRQGPMVRVPVECEVEEYLREYYASQDGDQDGGHNQPDQKDCHDPPGQPATANDASDGEKAQKTVPINTHDPDARLQKKGSERAAYRYQVSFCADAHNGLITDATASALEQAHTAVEHVDHDPGPVSKLAADGRYDDGDMLAQLHQRKVKPYVPRTDHDRAGQMSKDAFEYDAQRDVYICPAGATLTHHRYDKKRRQHHYRARVRDCRDCLWKAECTPSKCRTVTRRETEWARARTVHWGADYRRLQRRRRINEYLHMIGKRDHCLSRARGLGLQAMRIQAALTAIAINLKKLVGFGGRRQAQRCVAAIFCAAQALIWRCLRRLGPLRGLRPARGAICRRAPLARPNCSQHLTDTHRITHPSPASPSWLS